MFDRVALALMAAVGLVSSPTHAATVFDFGSGWNYFLGVTEASNPTTAWRQVGFPDGTWSNGPTPIGYGEPDIATTVPQSDEIPGQNYSVIFLRKTFTVTDPADISQLTLIVRVDDGAVVWINGVEVGRFNAPAGELPIGTFASTAPTQWSENTVQLSPSTSPAIGSVLQAGANVVAVQLLNGTLTSSDIFLDGFLDLVMVDPIPPTLVDKSPAPGTLNELTQITLSFSEPVQGVDAGDLLLNGQSASSVSGAGSTHTFFFPQPAFGNVTVGFNPGHGITDLAVPPNAFNHAVPEASWQYTLVDIFPPVMESVFPTINTTVRNLGEIQIRFNEDVTGVQLSDLLINGGPGTNLVALSPALYTFQFAEPAPGPVTVEWIAGHGIQDTAAVPNAFAGGSWEYVLDPNAVASLLYITEFMAANESVLLDEDGDAEDWIEIFNAGDIDADLDGWFLTDDDEDLEKWKFPSVVLPSGGYLVVFASNKDRTTPGLPLHTNFRLSNNGEFLALVHPDGETIASSFDPAFPAQVTDVSYGLPTVSAPVTLLQEGDAASYLVPQDGALGMDWTFLDYNDAAWSPAVNGIGFEGSPGASDNLVGAFNTDVMGAMRNINSSVYLRIPFVVQDPGQFDFLTLRMKYDDGFVAYLNGAEFTRRNAYVQLADSRTDFSGTQGSGGWQYGYYNKTLDGMPGYASADFLPFQGGAGFGAWNGFSQQWTGTAWDLNTASAAPWTSMLADQVHPNGVNNGDEHWTVRRFNVNVTGTLTAYFWFAKQNVGGGNGVTGYVFHNGLQVFSRTIAFNQSSASTNLVRIPGVGPGDVIDFAISPVGTDGVSSDGNDGTFTSIRITHDEGLFADWNIAASATHSDAEAVVFEEDNATGALPGLAQGPNVLAIHGLNSAVSDDDFLAAFELDGRSQNVDTANPRYFTAPTPGGPNGTGTDALGPVLSDLEHEPAIPQDNENLAVSVRVTQTFAAVSSVTLHYRVMYGAESTVSMADNGLGADAVAGDGIYSALIPAAASVPGEMVRWYVTAADANGNTSRLPAFEDPINSPEYDGTIVGQNIASDIPILYWFVQNIGSAGTDAGTRCSMLYEGEFYDNLGVNLHGQSSRGFPKRSYDVDFHRNYNFRWKEGEDRVDDINMMTAYPDKAYMRNVLAYETYRLADAAYHWVFPVRVQHNGNYLGYWFLMENGDENWLDRLGFDTEDALYKMYATFTALSHATISVNANAEKKSRKYEGNADLVDLYNGMVTGTTQTRTNYMWDNMDVPGTINYLAARILTQDRDCCHKNYYFYRETTGNGEWTGFAWDVDLSFGRNWNGTDTYWDNNLQFNNGLYVGNNNGVFGFVLGTASPQTRQMYLRRIRTLMDELLQPPGTPLAELRYEKMIDDIVDVIRVEAAQDLQQNGTWTQTSGSQNFNTSHPDYETLDEAVGRMKQILADRRNFMYNSLADLPGAQPADAVVNIGAIEYNPGTGTQAHEYFELLNPNNYAVDISGWQITGGVQHTFRGGTVIPSNGRLYVSPDVNGFRSRPISPMAGQGRFVQGNYSGQLTARGETINLVHKDGHMVATQTYLGNPSPAQNQLRVTEIMYHPAADTMGGPFDTEDYEYIELRNIGAGVLSLAGVRFTNGVDFDFTGSAVTQLQPGQRVLVVKSLAAYTSRHGAGALIAGEYTGQLDNGGESIRIDDIHGEKVLDFRYDDDWYATTDGLGFSLVIIDDTADWRTWDLKESWRASGAYNGSPGDLDPDPVIVAPVLLNEALTHTDPPQVDAIELRNPTTNSVDVGGWFLSDDFFDPRKFRIPDNTIIAAGGHHLFFETAFNPTPGMGQSFSLSSLGDEIYLFSGNGTDITGYFHGFDFGAAENGVSFGRHVISTGEEHFVAQVQTTLPGENAGPLVGPIVISEVHYHPVDLAGGQDNDDDEFIELHNISGAPAPLYDPLNATNSWVLDDAVEFVFPSGTTLPADGYLIVVGFSPAMNPALESAFRTKFSVPAGVPILGPFGGQLDNSGDSVELYKPDPPEPGSVPLVRVDKVRYRDEAPWPTVPDGYGPSLVREDDTAYGNDPANWRGAAPTPGRASGTGTAPAITEQPQDTIGVSGQTASFSVQAGGTPLLQYQWMSPNGPVPNGTSSTVLLTDLDPGDSGFYHVAVYNEVGATISSNALLQVLIPAVIVQQPESAARRLGSNVTFTVSAFSPSGVTYQWLKDGGVLPGATNDTLILDNLQESDGGDYSVLITDLVATIESDVATLTILIDPTVELMQLAYSVVQGGSVILSVEAGGSIPMSYRWRKNFATLKLEQLNSRKSFVRLDNVQPVVDGGTGIRYTVVLTNAASYTPGVLSPSAFITVLTDGDGDGLPDVWEDDNGLDSTTPGDENSDEDMDGMTAGEEYVAGTDPNDENSYLRVESIAVGGGTTLTFNAVAERSYTIEYTDSLEIPAWMKLDDVVSGPDRVVTIMDLNGTATRYYRLVTPRQE